MMVPSFRSVLKCIGRQRRHLFLLALLALIVDAPNHDAAASVITYNGGTTEESDWQSAAAPTSLENFSSYSAGTQISSLPALGISFATLDGGGFPVTYAFGGTPHGPMQLANFPNGINAINQFDDIVLNVLPGFQITAFGFWNGDGQSDTLTATAYDELNNVIGSVGAFKGTFGGLIADTSIASIVFDGNTGDGWNHLDGLQTNAIPAVPGVPEPATCWLLVSGIIGLLAYRRSH
ncbi:MAG: hypothetical protein ACKVT0_09475 [Planctomycetaceae bacterium]